MDNSQSKELVERFYTLLHFQLLARLPKKDGVHIYSTGALLSSVKTNIYEEGIEITIGEGLDYGAYALGFNDEGEERSPRYPKPTSSNPNPKPLEAMNFKIINDCVEEVAKCLAEIGGVTVNGNPI